MMTPTLVIPTAPTPAQFLPTASKARHPSRVVPTLVLLALAGGGDAVAAAQPDAGSLRQQIEQQRALPLPEESSVAPAAPASGASPESGVTVTVTGFRFTGNTLLTGDELQLALQPYLHRPLAFDELQQAVARAAAAYREAGWVASAHLPAQEITEGVVTIRIVEASYAGARLEGEAPGRVAPAQVLAPFGVRQQVGAPVSLRALDRALLLADDLPGVSVRGALGAGPELGATELLLRTTDEAATGARVLIDNAGARSTGAHRAIVVGHLYSQFRPGDQLDGTLLHSKGNDYLWANYSLPAGPDGWRVHVEGAYLRYRLTASDFSALDGRGRSTSIGLGGSYPLIRARQHNLYLDLRAARDVYRNEANAMVQSQYRVHTASATLTGNVFDALGGGGSTAVSLKWTAGDLGLKLPDPGENPALAGGFDRLELRASRLQNLAQRWTLQATLRAQLGSRQLDSSQRFHLGGPNGVRAYPVNEGSGHQGALFNVELRRRLAYDTSLTAFYDWGHVTDAGAGGDYELDGYGIGFAWQAPRRIELAATLARRLGSHPSPLSTGRDQDGSRERTRVWLTASHRF